MKKLMVLAGLSLLLAASCKDEAEQIPVYLKVQPFTVNEPGGGGWQEITEAWMYVNDEFLGAYSLPADIPVLAEGDTRIAFFPGVKENGISATPNIFPYLLRSNHTLNLTAGQSVNITPTTAYDNNAVFAFGKGRGDFDGGSFIGLENRDSDGELNVQLTTNGAFAGECILMHIDSLHPIMNIATEKMEELPYLGGSQVWLEMHYKNDIPFFLYLLSGTGENNQSVYQFNNSDEWNKIYINLTDAIVNSQSGTQRLYFRLSLPRDGSGNFTQKTGTVRIDNVRVLHY